MRGFRNAWLMIMPGVLLACTSWQADYLTHHIHEASQDEVAARLGRPTETKPLPGGGTEWVYHYFPDSMFNYAYKGHPFEPDCQEYILTFNERQVLTYWLKQECIE